MQMLQPPTSPLLWRITKKVLRFAGRIVAHFVMAYHKSSKKSDNHPSASSYYDISKRQPFTGKYWIKGSGLSKDTDLS